MNAVSFKTLCLQADGPIVAIAAPRSISSRPRLNALQAFHKHFPFTLPRTTWTFHCAPEAGWALRTTSEVPPLVQPPDRSAPRFAALILSRGLFTTMLALIKGAGGKTNKATGSVHARDPHAVKTHPTELILHNNYKHLREIEICYSQHPFQQLLIVLLVLGAALSMSEKFGCSEFHQNVQA
ncbi:hypothetical protein HUJ05_009122 [Dendroctonus ponderosae]|nr:hypothetical protein HUJ05_009122 [Dendroctonus ponderosae]